MLGPPRGSGYVGLSKPDRRTQRTRQALMGAFIDLLLERGYDKISGSRPKGNMAMVC